jgi:hypothetical protein
VNPNAAGSSFRHRAGGTARRADPAPKVQIVGALQRA